MYDTRLRDAPLTVPGWVRSLGVSQTQPKKGEVPKVGSLYRPKGHFGWLKVKKVVGETIWVASQNYASPSPFPVKLSLLQGAERKEK